MKLSQEEEKLMLLAEKAYKGYCNYTGGKSAVTGDSLPQWTSIPGAIKNAWFASMKAIFNK